MDASLPAFIPMPQCIFLVLHDLSGQTVLAALHENDENDSEKYGEEDEPIKKDKMLKDFREKRKNIMK